MDPEKKLSGLSHEENLEMKNNLLKAKLTAEFGMKHSSLSLDSEIENQWLNYIYDFEKSYSDAGRISIYEFLGKPDHKPVEELNRNDVTAELKRLFEIMEKNGIVLDILCDYEDELIYKFITEEFFQEETDNMRIEGMNHCFIYEEFHPNHQYDLTNQTDDFIHSLIEKEWDKEFDKYYLNENIKFRNKDYDRDAFMKFIISFQEAHKPLKLKTKEISKVEFDPVKGIAEVNGTVFYKAFSESYSGEYRFKYILDNGFWNIEEVEFPNFG